VMPLALAGGAIPCVQPKREPRRAPKILHARECGNRNANRRDREFRNKWRNSRMSRRRGS
jgi:hypothetical protein